MEKLLQESEPLREMIEANKGKIGKPANKMKKANRPAPEEEKFARKKIPMKSEKKTKRPQNQPISPKPMKKMIPIKNSMKGRAKCPMEEMNRRKESDKDLDYEALSLKIRNIDMEYLKNINKQESSEAVNPQARMLQPKELEKMTKDQIIVRKYSNEELEKPKDNWAGKFAELLSKNPQEFKFEDDEDINECVICFEPLDNGEPLKNLPCTHYFHEECIDDWFEKKEKCPVCNTNFKTNGADSDDDQDDDDDWFNN